MKPFGGFCLKVSSKLLCSCMKVVRKFCQTLIIFFAVFSNNNEGTVIALLGLSPLSIKQSACGPLFNGPPRGKKNEIRKKEFILDRIKDLPGETWK